MAAPSRITVVVRKRPLGKAEGLRGEADIVDCLQETGRVLVHEPRTRVDLTKEVAEHRFCFDGAFGEACSNAAVYRATVARVVPTVFQGGR